MVKIVNGDDGVVAKCAVIFINCTSSEGSNPRSLAVMGWFTVMG